MKIKTKLFNFFLAASLVASLTACKKDKESNTASDIGSVTFTVQMTQNDVATPIENAEVRIFNGDDETSDQSVLNGTDVKTRQTDEEGKLEVTDLLVAPYYVVVLDENKNYISEKVIQVLPGENNVTIEAQP